MRTAVLGTMVLALLALAGCDSPSERKSADDSVLLKRQERLAQALNSPDSTDPNTPMLRWKLPDQLKEISGLALTRDGRLLTHGDERAKIYEIDFRRGSVVKEFTLGSPAVHGDFESITMVRDSVLLLASDGVLYQSAEGADKATVASTRLDTGLGASCEFEGMTFDSTANLLLMICKKVHDKALKDSLVIFRWPLGVDPKGKARKVTHLAVALPAVIGNNGWDRFEPSDIAIDPASGNYVIVASRQQGLLDLTPAGVVVFSRPLPPGHEQAEGIAITRDGLLLISDEARGGPALITAYRWLK